MTFYEAALHVLSQHNRALHYKKITEIALREQLLSHVGKTPEVTMRTRLNLEVKKAEGAEVKRERPGVFSLSEAYEPREFVKPKPSTPNPTPTPSRNDRRRNDRRRNNDRNGDRNSDRNNRRQDQEEQTQQAQSNQQNDNEQRDSRRRRDNRKDNRQDNRQEGRQDNRQNSRQERSTRNDDRQESRRKTDAKRMAYAEDPELFDDESYNAPVKQERNTRRSSSRRNTQRVAPFGLDGIAEAAYTVLRADRYDSMPLDKLASAIFDRKLVKFHTHNPSLTVQSAIINDNQSRLAAGHRPLFVDFGRNRWGLSEQGLSDETLSAEKEILSLSEEMAQQTAQTLSDVLATIPTDALEQIVLTILERAGYEQIKISKRGGNDDVYFSALQSGLSQTRVCVQVIGQTDRELRGEDIAQLRGTLHHYGASAAVIVHLGSVSEDAMAEVQEEKLASVTIMQREDIVQQMIQAGLGVRTYHAPMVMVDTTFASLLGSK